MKKLTIMIVLNLFFIIACTSDKVVMKAKHGDVTYDHKFHSTTLECAHCHGDGKPEKIIMDKDKAHSMCIGCHIEKGTAPTKCKECH